MQEFTGQNQTAIETITRGLINSIVESKWEDANNFIL
jgi:hypothetical protein